MLLQLIDRESIIKLRVAKAIQRRVTDIVQNAVDVSIIKVDKLIEKRIKESSTYKSLTGDDGIGELRGEFGLDGSSVQILRRNVNLLYTVKQGKIRPSKASTKGVQFTSAIDITISPPLELFSFITEGSVENEPTVIPWLEWLLLAGTSPQIPNYTVKFKQGYGRSKLAVMIKVKGQEYSVSSFYSGTSNNNWLTRVITEAREDIEKILMRNFAKSRKSIGE